MNYIASSRVTITDNPEPFFDWYQATIHHLSPENVVDMLRPHFLGADLKPAGGLKGYDRGFSLIRGDHELLRGAYHSTGKTTGVYLRSSGSDSQQLWEALRTIPHNVTRADSAIDYVEQGIYDWMSERLIEFAQERNLKISYLGDWARGNNRTLYIGSRKSTVFLRVYEKGHKEGADPNWIRFEVEVKPTKEKRKQFSAFDAKDYQRVGRWLTDARAMLGIQVENTIPASRPRTITSTIKTRLALINQYKAILSDWNDQFDTAEEFAENLINCAELAKKQSDENITNQSKLLELLS